MIAEIFYNGQVRYRRPADDPDVQETLALMARENQIFGWSRYSVNWLRINESFKAQFPDNCPIIEVDGDGNEVGTCTFYMKDGKCPRHGGY